MDDVLARRLGHRPRPRTDPRAAVEDPRQRCRAGPGVHRLHPSAPPRFRTGGGMTSKPETAQVNPIVRKAADQVANAKRRTAKPKDLPRWECRDQLSLFDPLEGAGKCPTICSLRSWR